VSLDSLNRAVHEGDQLLLDSSMLIAYLDGQEATSPIASHIVEQFVRRDRNTALISTVTAMEILVRPLQRGASHGQHVYAFLTSWPHMQVVPVDLPIAHQAATLRAAYALKPADALIVASGLLHGVGVLVTNDERWKKAKIGNIRVCYLSDHLPFP
jgi:predicted nucleic acid-binding protein